VPPFSSYFPAQFHDEDFIKDTVIIGNPPDAFDYAIGGYFVVRTHFGCQRIDMTCSIASEGNNRGDPFQNFPYP